MDTLSTEQRSKNMSAIHSTNTKPEIYLRKLLFARGYRYTINSSNIPGHPDIYLRKYNTAIFVHGCFWHRHKNCKYAYMPKTRVEFWQSKFENNVRRDSVVRDSLESSGIKQLIVWECAIRQSQKKGYSPDLLITYVTNFLSSHETYCEISSDIYSEKEQYGMEDN